MVDEIIAVRGDEMVGTSAGRGARSPEVTIMASTVLDSELFADIFGAAEMRAIFSDENTVACYVRAEVALAVAQGKRRRDPARARRRHRGQSAAGRARPRANCARKPRMSAIPSSAWCGNCRPRSATPAATCIGARPRRTSWIPRVVLQVRDGARAGRTRSRRGLRQRWKRSRVKHRDTRWPGAPICSRRCRSPSATRRRSGSSMIRAPSPIASQQLRERVLVAQLGGAAGTLASLGDAGLDVRAQYAAALGLARARHHLARRARRPGRERCSCSA